MNTLSEHYGLLLGLDRSWRVVNVDLSLEEKRVRIQIEHVPGTPACCPECSVVRPLKDHAPQRSWRHLDTMQFETVLIARVPRTECPDCGVKTIEVPWAEPHGRFTLMFEAIRHSPAAGSQQHRESPSPFAAELDERAADHGSGCRTGTDHPRP